MKRKKDPFMTCLVCGHPEVEIHHVFYGTANRAKSEKYGYVIPLCHYHHRDPVEGIHFNKALDSYFKRIFQERFEEDHSREEFISEFGRSYI